MQSIELHVIRQQHSGFCEKCGKSGVVNTIEMVDGDKRRRTTLCPFCGNDLYALVEKKNLSAVQSPMQSTQAVHSNPKSFESKNRAAVQSQTKTANTIQNYPKKEKKKIVAENIIVSIALLIPIVLLALAPKVYNYFNNVGSATYEKAVEKYIDAAYSSFDANKTINQINGELFNGMCEKNGITSDQAFTTLSEALSTLKDSITGYTFNTNPTPDYVIRNVESEAYNIPTLSARLYLFGFQTYPSDAVRVNVDLYYLLSPGLADPEATESLLVMQFDKRWYVVDSDLISEVFPQTFDE